MSVLYPSADGDRVEWGLVLPTDQPHWWAAGTTDFTGQISGGSGAYGDTDLYTFDTVPSTVVITRLRVHMLGHWRSDSFGNAIFELVMRQGGVDTLCGEVTMVAGPTNFNEEFVWDFDYDPTQVGSVAWTPDRVNSGQFGFALHSAPDDISNTAFEAVFIEILSPQDLYLFGSSTSAGHTNVFQRDGVGTWYLLASANPDNLYFQGISTDYASMLPNGYSVDGNLYSYRMRPGFDINRFNYITRKLEAGITYGPGSTFVAADFVGVWARDISDPTGKAVAWLPQSNSNSFYWDGVGPYWNSPHDSAWQWDNSSSTDFTSFPKDVISDHFAPIEPYMTAVGGHLFLLNNYYYTWAYSGIRPSASVTEFFYGAALLRFENSGTPPDVATRIHVGGMRFNHAPLLPAVGYTGRGQVDYGYPLDVLPWNGHVWLPSRGSSHVRLSDNVTIVTTTDEKWLFLLRSDGTVVDAQSLPSAASTGTYREGRGVFYHEETNHVYSWILYGSTYTAKAYMALFRLDAYDVAAGTFTWTPLAHLGPMTNAYGLVGAVGDTDALYFGFSEYIGGYTHQKVNRYDIATDTWTTESVIGLTGDEYMGTLVKLAGTVPVSIARFSFGTIIG